MQDNTTPTLSVRDKLVFVLLGVYFGIVISKSEAISWFRIQEMFRFQSLHMYGLLFSAIFTAAISLKIIRNLNLKDFSGKEISIEDKDKSVWKSYLFGGLCFGVGWAMTGACPGPLYTLIGTGMTVMIVPLFFALIGAWTYGYLKPRLPH